MKKKTLNIVCGVLLFAIVGTLIWGLFHKESIFQYIYSDGIEQIDINNIYLGDSGVHVSFADVLVSNQKESRKLMVSTQEATVSIELTDRIFKSLDFDFLKKTQSVSYTGKGYFVVDLDHLTKEDVIEDKKNKVLTIQIDHAYLQVVEIDPDKIMIGEVKESLLARGDIELTVKDYNEIEKELRYRLETMFNTAENGQAADRMALQMVKEVYAPLVKAMDASYNLNIVFK